MPKSATPGPGPHPLPVGEQLALVVSLVKSSNVTRLPPSP